MVCFMLQSALTLWGKINWYMEHFERQALSSAAKKPTKQYKYVDDTFVVWPHGEDELQRFLEHLNSIHQNIAFTMEVE